MKLVIEIPDSIADRMEAKWGNVERRALELLAADAYRAEAIAAGQVRQMLRFSSPWETHGFLKQEGAYLHYTEADLEQDVEAIRKIMSRGIGNWELGIGNG